jgi:hypothetical protein
VQRRLHVKGFQPKKKEIFRKILKKIVKFSKKKDFCIFIKPEKANLSKN